MGTSTGYDLPTTGNWPSTKGEVTRWTNSASSDTGKVAQKYTQAVGGAAQAAQNLQAANQAAAKLGGFLQAVQRRGLGEALRETGLGRFVGSTMSDLLEGLQEYFVENNGQMEDAVVQEAYLDFRNEFFEQYDSLDSLENGLSQHLQDFGLQQMLERFFGNVIYTQFKRDFSERIAKVAFGMKAVNRKLSEMRQFIDGKLAELTHGRRLERVNWGGQEGRALITQIHTAVWNVFGES